jgi:hypothetical protein
MMRRILVLLSLMSVMGCADLFNRNVVARAGHDELSVEWFAATLTQGDYVPQPTAVERWAWLWVQYALFLQRVAAGDSLVDTATVLEAMWPEVLINTVNNYYDRLIAEHVTISEERIDSAYAAGEHRMVDHILISMGPGFAVEENQRRRRLAESIRARLNAGADWDRQVRNSDDPATRDAGGRLGLITAGEMVPEFEQAAYELEPGEISQLVETRFGLHIIRRPHLEEVREEFTQSITTVLVDRWKEQYLEELSAERQLQVLDEGPEIMRDAADRPIRVLALEPGRVIGTYDGGQLTDVTFVGWLAALPAWEHMSIEGAGDEELKEKARLAMQNEILFLEAKSVGTRLEDGQFGEIKGQLSRRLRRLRSAMRVDTVMARAAPEERQRIATEVLQEYVMGAIGSRRSIEPVPPFLARKLRAESDWHFSYAGVNRAVRRAVELGGAEMRPRTRPTASNQD